MSNNDKYDFKSIIDNPKIIHSYIPIVMHAQCTFPHQTFHTSAYELHLNNGTRKRTFNAIYNTQMSLSSRSQQRTE